MEIWLISMLLIAGCLMLGFQAGQWSANAEHTQQLAEVRNAYDAALGKRDRRLDRLAETTTQVADRVESAASIANQAAHAASRAADKADEALCKANQ
ncbi:putative lipoprotein [Pseudomonas syringae pv. pisi str. 1704B]|uniref:Putative lipoprotein n=1 Tax=Pseudomonas syringae pv. pisi str. 1704B TaxID=629263 RepID=F3G4P4_PSESJ|nr:putative lipoprotein [Pseudomonas syringae pv. pisi str. 1704B]